MTLPNTRPVTSCPHCRGAMSLIRLIDELPEIYIFYCSPCEHVETVKYDRAA